MARIDIGRNEIELAQAGDCMAVVEQKSGKIIVSPNQTRAHDAEMHAHIERLLREIAQETLGLALEEVPEEKREQLREEMWNRFYPILLEARRKDVNQLENLKGYGLLNGQFGFIERWQELLWEQTFPVEEVATILFFSDGMVPWSVMQATNDDEIGRAALAEFKQSGLVGLLLSARAIEQQTAATSYIGQAETTAIALSFSDE